MPGLEHRLPIRSASRAESRERESNAPSSGCSRRRSQNSATRERTEGLEPSLFLGGSQVPHRIGIARVDGEQGSRTPHAVLAKDGSAPAGSPNARSRLLVRQTGCMTREEYLARQLSIVLSSRSKEQAQRELEELQMDGVGESRTRDLGRATTALSLLSYDPTRGRSTN